MERKEAFAVVFALVCGLLAVFWPSVERLSGCPYLAANPEGPGDTRNPHEASPTSRYIGYGNGVVLMAGDEGTDVASGFVVDATTGSFVSLWSPSTPPSSDDIIPDETVDLQGAIVTPGFVDAHVHFLSLGLGLLGRIIDVGDVTAGDHLAERMLSRVRSGGGPDDEDETLWAVAFGFQHDFTNASWLEAIDRPAVVFRFDSHQLLANSKALEIAGVTADTPSPDGGQIMRDASGNPTGVLCDAAMGLVTNVLPPSTDDQLREAFYAAEEHALRQGITRVGDMGRVSFDDEFASFNDVQNIYIPMPEVSAPQRIRVDAFVTLRAQRALGDLIDTLGNTFSHGRLRIGGVKTFYDGSLSSRTALFSRPYADGDGVNAGIRLVDPEAWEEQVRAADSDGMHVATHAIGNQAVDEVLDVYERLPNRHRHRIEHAQHISSLETIKRMAKAGIAGLTPNPQHWVYDRGTIPARLHVDDAKLSFPLAEFKKARVTMALASDAPVVPLDPLTALENAIDTSNPFSITPWDALHGLTRGGHILSLPGEPGERLGYIAAGWKADFVVHQARCDQQEPCTLETAVQKLLASRADRVNETKHVYIAGERIM